MPKFTSKNFMSVYHTDLGKAIWDFLLEPITLRSLVLSVLFNKAPVSAISDLLVSRFGSKTPNISSLERLREGFDSHSSGYDTDHLKRYIGTCIRIILEDLGYTISSKHSNANDPKEIFTKSARYKSKP